MTLEELCPGPVTIPRVLCFQPFLAWPEGRVLGYKELEGYPPHKLALVFFLAWQSSQNIWGQ